MENHERAWSILREVDDALQSEQDGKGDLKNTGEARALWRMKRQLQGAIAQDATEFLKRAGYGASGQRRKNR